MRMCNASFPRRGLILFDECRKIGLFYGRERNGWLVPLFPINQQEGGRYGLHLARGFSFGASDWECV